MAPEMTFCTKVVQLVYTLRPDTQFRTGIRLA